MGSPTSPSSASEVYNTPSRSFFPAEEAPCDEAFNADAISGVSIVDASSTPVLSAERCRSEPSSAPTRERGNPRASGGPPPFGRGTFVRRRSRCRALIDRRAIPRRFVNLDDGGGGGSDTRGIFLRVVRLRLRLCGCLRGRLRLRLRLARDRRLLPLLLTEFTFEFFPGARFLLGRRRRRRRSASWTLRRTSRLRRRHPPRGLAVVLVSVLFLLV